MKLTSYLKCLFICLLTVVILSKCANPVSPTGGPKDITPPSVLESEPENYSTNFTAEKIELNFDEFVEFDESNKQLLISPPLDNKPEFKIRGKSLIIEPRDELKKNSTYTLFFGDAIKDITEKNPLLNYQYVFATGNTLDSLTIKGKVLDAFNLQPEVEEVFVMLYLDNNDTIPFDSIPYFSRPYYIAKTDEEGSFQLKNLKNENYKIFALKDANSNYLYDLPNEEIAYIDSLLSPEYFKSFVVSDSLLNDTTLSEIVKDSLIKEEFRSDSIKKYNIHNFYKLHLFDEIDSTQKFIGAEIVREGQVNFLFKFPTHNLLIKSLNYSFGDECKIIERMNPGKDTLTYWFTKNYPDTVLFQISQDTTVLDTTEVILLQKDNKPDIAEDTITALPSLKFNTNIQSNLLNLNSKLSLEFPRPLTKFDFHKVLLIIKEADTINPQIEFSDKIKRKIFINENFEEGEKYGLFFPDSVFTDILDHSNDTAHINFTVKQLRDYGTLQLNISNLKSGINYILQLLDDRDNLLKEINISEDGIVNLEYLKPLTLTLKLILDSNKNGRWDTGDYIKKIPPEKVYYFGKKLEIRANWDIEENWDL